MATAASQHASLHYPIHRSLHGTTAHAHTHTRTHNVYNLSEFSYIVLWFICVIIVLQCYRCLFLSLSLPTWSFSETLSFLQQTKGPHNVSRGLSFSPSPSPLCIYVVYEMLVRNHIEGNAVIFSVNTKIYRLWRTSPEFEKSFIGPRWLSQSSPFISPTGFRPPEVVELSISSLCLGLIIHHSTLSLYVGSCVQSCSRLLLSGTVLLCLVMPKEDGQRPDWCLQVPHSNTVCFFSHC